MRVSDLSELVFETAKFLGITCLGKVGDCVNVPESVARYERVVLAAGPLGIMQACHGPLCLPSFRPQSFGPAYLRFPIMQAKICRHVRAMERGQGLRLHVALRIDDGRITAGDGRSSRSYTRPNAPPGGRSKPSRVLGGNAINDFPPGGFVAPMSKLLREICRRIIEIRRMLYRPARSNQKRRP